MHMRHHHHHGERGGWRGQRHAHDLHEGFEGRFGGGSHGRRGRVFDQGDLRLLLLSLIAEQPSHGYELIRLIEEKLGGAYTPSPGVVYPTLTLLEELGYATVEAQEGGRKLYSVTDAGRAHLAESAETVQRMRGRMDDARERSGHAPAPAPPRHGEPAHGPAAEAGDRRARSRAGARPGDGARRLRPGGGGGLMGASHGRAETASARRYLSQLCKHWSHRFEVRFDETSGEIALPSGPCRLKAEPDGLEIALEAEDASQLDRMEQVVADHLKRFAFREPFEVTWTREVSPA